MHVECRSISKQILLAGLVTCISLPASAEITFLCDWEDFGSQFQKEGPKTRLLDGQPVEWIAGRGPNQWRVVMEKGDDRLEVEHDPSSPKGGAVLRVEVRPGDFLGYSGERAEVVEMLGPTGNKHVVTSESGHEVYGISVKLDSKWQPPLHDKTHGGWQWGIFMQLHSPNLFGGPPALALTATDHFGINTLAGDFIGVDGKRRDVTEIRLANGELRLGHWVEFLVDVVWAYDSSGSLVVYRRDEGESNFIAVLSQTAQPTLQFNSQFPDSRKPPRTDSEIANSHYWRAGYYRSFSPGVISRLWLGPIVRGTSLQEVTNAAFGK